MHINLIGVNHRTAPLAIREKVAIGAGELGDALKALRCHIGCGVVLSTCNRTEVYTVGDCQASGKFLAARLGVAENDLLEYASILADGAAVEHLFRVACGLDSMVVGEFEVLGQVKTALEAAEKAGMVDLPLRHIFHRAVRSGRRAREETAIGKSALSVSSVAVDLAEKTVGDLHRCKIVVIGAGEAGRLVAKVARDRGIAQLVIASRVKERAEPLAKTLGGTPIGMNSLADELVSADIVVGCAAAPHAIVDAGRIAGIMRHRPDTPLVVIDIALPRNVAPDVAQLRNVVLYNIDDLTEISKLNRKQRENEVHKTERIIADELGKFTAWWREFQVKPLVTALMSKAEQVRATQLSRTLKKLGPLSDEQRESLEAMTRSIVTRILEDPVQHLKASGNGSYSETVRELFGLDTEKPR